MIKIESRVLGPVATNCYLIINLDNNESIIVDPADSPESIYDMVVRSASRPQAILLTHGHFDHIGAANEVREHYGIKIYASCDEERYGSLKAIFAYFTELVRESEGMGTAYVSTAVELTKEQKQAVREIGRAHV